MKNVMVCVTQQKNCDRLMEYGYELHKQSEGELYIVHVTLENVNFMGDMTDGEALEYLYEKALEYGANMTVIKSNDILFTLIEQMKENQITHVVLGESGKKHSKGNLIKKLEHKLIGQVEIIVIPA